MIKGEINGSIDTSDGASDGRPDGTSDVRLDGTPRCTFDGLHDGRRLTGRCFLVEINNKDKLTFQEVIERYVRPGTEVWTDEHKSYNWLNEDSRYGHAVFSHDCVIHSVGEFSRRRADGVNVSTNAIEGMLSMVKRDMRNYHAIPSIEHG